MLGQNDRELDDPDSGEESMSVSTHSLDRDEDSSSECWDSAVAEVEGILAHWGVEDSVMGITLMVPLSCTSSTEARFINSFPNSESIN